MLVVTARLFKDNQLVGYRLSDGQSTQDLTKQQVWVYAKNKQITNVIAVGTEAEPSISGTNGFELKKLPEITVSNNDKSSAVSTTQDLRAADLHSRISNLSNEEFNKAMSYELTDAEYQELEDKLREKEKHAFEQMFEGTHYTPKDLPKLLSGMPGNTRQEKTNNLIEFLKEDKLKREVTKNKQLRMKETFRDKLKSFGINLK